MSKEAALGCGVQTAHLRLRAAGSPAPLRPALPDLPVETVLGLAFGIGRGSAGDRRSLAPASLPSVVALEVPSEPAGASAAGPGSTGSPPADGP
jgi:hypothetical protein